MFQHTDFCSMQEQDKLLKKGVLDELKLTLIDEDKKKNQTVSVWIKEV